jgi:hypothetical protein
MRERKKMLLEMYRRIREREINLAGIMVHKPKTQSSRGPAG